MMILACGVSRDGGVNRRACAFPAGPFWSVLRERKARSPKKAQSANRAEERPPFLNHLARKNLPFTRKNFALKSTRARSSHFLDEGGWNFPPGLAARGL